MKEAKDSLKKNYLKEDDTKMSKKNKVVLVTGGSSGIGAATVDLLAENGATVIAAARRTDKLETLVSTLLQKDIVQIISNWMSQTLNKCSISSKKL